MGVSKEMYELETGGNVFGAGGCKGCIFYEYLTINEKKGLVIFSFLVVGDFRLHGTEFAATDYTYRT